jgi:uncharacterized membrane protein YvlD (DUF360 family)
MGRLRSFIIFLIRLAIIWAVDALSLMLMATWLDGFTLEPVEGFTPFQIAVSAALLLGVLNFVIRPVVLLLVVPLGAIAIFLIGFVLNALFLLLISGLLPGFSVDNFWWALLGGLVFSLINTILTNLMTIDDDDSYYANLVLRLAAREPFPPDTQSGQGLLMLEVDGLSYHHMDKALDEGYMPTLSRLMKEQGYQLSRVETGLPCMTSSCQAGILYGDNYDIPSFRWYDRDLGRFIVSHQDAAMLDQRYSRGQGLTRQGSSVGNMLSGGAAKSHFVIATLKTAGPEEKKQRARDIYLLMINPYFLVRSVVLLFWDAIVEVWQYWRQVRQNVQPRLNRLHNGYPLMRAALTSFLKDVSAYLIILDIVRGSPAIYHTYAGYDEMAHHAGPWTKDALNELKRFDQVIARLLRVIEEKAPRPYELVVLSDHGQSFGHTFLQRYGLTLEELIRQNMHEQATVARSAGGDDGLTGMHSLVGEMQSVQEEGVGGRLGRSVVSGGATLLEKGIAAREQEAPQAQTAAMADVIVAFSGNLANVYFGKFGQRAHLSELDAAYPGMVDALVAHEGVGFVLGYSIQGAPQLRGKNGSWDLSTGVLTGADPLLPFTGGDPAQTELRLWQLRHLAEFPHTGDLVVNSAVFSDGTVAAMEELIGSHGGLGGEQTDSFLFHPDTIAVPETRHVTEVFSILDSRRGLQPVEAPVVSAPPIVPLAPSTLLTGLGQVGRWLNRAARALVFDREAYAAVSADVYMTGPALLILLLTSFIPTLVFGESYVNIATRLGVWLLVGFLITLGGRLLGGSGRYDNVLRATGFATISYLWLLLALVPQFAPLARLIFGLALLLNVWLGSSQALKLRGWKSLILPIAAYLVLVIGVALLENLLTGVGFTVQSILAALGLVPAP